MGLLGILRRLIRRAPPRVPVPRASVPTPAALLDALNAARRANGRPPLAEDPAASVVAQHWAGTMAARGILTHGDFPGRATWGTAVEDIAEGQATAAQAVGDWMGDPPHRAAVLGPYDRVGLGVAADRDGDLYWVADFYS